MKQIAVANKSEFHIHGGLSNGPPSTKPLMLSRCEVFTKLRWLFLLLSFCLFLFVEDTLSQEYQMQVCGWLEKVRVFPGDLVFRAKMDTGAKHSSLNARSIVEFEKEGESWVRFIVRDRKGKKLQMERPLVRKAEIKLRSKQNRTQDRPVIYLGICLGSTYKEVEVNLVDRSNFNYQMLIGRSYLSGDFFVDASETFTLQPNCRIEAEP
jgi:hypothetical protein